MGRKKKKKELAIRLDFNTDSRKIVEVYEISPDGRKIRIAEGWVSSYRNNVITMRGRPGRGFLSDEQIAFLIQGEKILLADKKCQDRGAYIIAKKYPIREWLKREEY